MNNNYPWGAENDPHAPYNWRDDDDDELSEEEKERADYEIGLYEEYIEQQMEYRYNRHSEY